MRWFIAQINLYLTSLTHLGRATSSHTNVHEEEGGDRLFVNYQDTGADLAKNVYASDPLRVVVLLHLLCADLLHLCPS